MPDLGGQGWLGDLGLRDRLPHSKSAGLAPIAQRQACTASSALEPAQTDRFGTLGRVPAPFLLRSDNGLVSTSRSFTVLVHSYGLKQEFITPHCPQQNGMVERVIGALKEQCTHRHRFETL